MQPTRRGFIAGSLLLPLTQTSTKAGLKSVTVSLNEEIPALLRRRDELLEQRRQLDERWKIAYEQLPDWCRPGPKYRGIDGHGYGPRVGWPPLSKPIQVEGLGFLVRASPHDLREIFEKAARNSGLSDTIGGSYRASISNLRAQMSERRRVTRAVGLPQTADWLPIDQGIEKIEALLA
ncbi:hypothetical protein [Afipia felis]